MTFSTNVPNAAQSPSLFPSQANANWTRLKDIINAEHVFNDTSPGAPPNTDGVHKQMTMIAKAAHDTLPVGTNAELYTKTVSGASQLFYWNGVDDYQVTPADTAVSGTVNIVSTGVFYTVTAIPANMFGEIFLFKGRFIQSGNFVSDATVVNGYAYAQKYVNGSSASQILNLGFDGDGASGLNLRVQNDGSGSGFNGVWTYKIFYRPKA